MFRKIIEWIAGLAGLEVIDPTEPKPAASSAMVSVMQRALDRANDNCDHMFHDYEHRVIALTLEVERLKRELAQK